MNKLLATAAAVALSLGIAGSASAAVLVYDFNFYAAGFTPPLGTVTISDTVANTVQVDVNLADNTFFQLTNGDAHDALWWDLSGGTGALTYNFTAPAGGTYPTGGSFTGGQYIANGYGQGFLSGFDYGVIVADAINPNNYYGGTSNLTFTVSRAGLSTASFIGESANNGKTTQTVVFGADLRQCITEQCVTGPAGTTLRTAVPEPATWAMMIGGFGMMGAMLRRRRTVIA